MIVTDVYMKRGDDVILVKTYSDAGYYISNEKNELYQIAVDPKDHTHTYIESDLKIDMSIDDKIGDLYDSKEDNIITVNDIYVDGFIQNTDYMTRNFKWIGRIENENIKETDYVTLTYEPEANLNSLSSYCISHDGYVDFYSTDGKAVTISTMTITKG